MYCDSGYDCDCDYGQVLENGGIDLYTSKEVSSCCHCCCCCCCCCCCYHCHCFRCHYSYHCQSFCVHISYYICAQFRCCHFVRHSRTITTLIITFLFYSPAMKLKRTSSMTHSSLSIHHHPQHCHHHNHHHCHHHHH